MWSVEILDPNLETVRNETNSTEKETVEEEEVYDLASFMSENEDLFTSGFIYDSDSPSFK